MNAPTLLRVAAGVALLQGAAHATLILTARPKHGAEEVAVVDAMKSHRFDFAGARRSYWDFYFGYAMEAALVCVVEAVLLWQLGALAGSAAGTLKSIILLLIVANVGHALLALRYFFITPVVPDVAIAVCLALALAA